MTEQSIIRGKLFGDGKTVDVEVVGGKVRAVVPATRRKAVGNANTIIAPPLFDIQVNGVMGIDLHGATIRPEDFRTITNHMARWGVSHWVPTFVTSSLRDMEKGCRAYVASLSDPIVAAAAPGLHLEGPHISKMDGPRGAHPLRRVKPPRIKDFNRLYDAAEGKILYETLAPELPGAVAYIRALVKRGVAVSLGHHHATAEQITKAVDAGATLSTHLGNGALPTINRHQNIYWPQLAEDRLHASFIADLHHLPMPMLKTFTRCKGPNRSVLVSDCVHLTGLKPGKYELFEGQVELLKTGKICLTGTDLLAGSGMHLIQGVVNVARHTDFSLEEAFASATTVPAQLLQQKINFDLPKKGRKANFIAYHEGQKKPVFDAIYIGGQKVT